MTDDTRAAASSAEPGGADEVAEARAVEQELHAQHTRTRTCRSTGSSRPS